MQILLDAIFKWYFIRRKAREAQEAARNAAEDDKPEMVRFLNW